MHSKNLDGAKFKRICTYFTNIEILTNRAMSGKIQVTFGNATIGNKSLRETVTTFNLIERRKSLTVVSIDTKCASARDNIRLPTTEVLPHASFSDLIHSKNICNWATLSVILLPTLLTEVVIFDGQEYLEDLLKIFAIKI